MIQHICWRCENKWPAERMRRWARIHSVCELCIRALVYPGRI